MTNEYLAKQAGPVKGQKFRPFEGGEIAPMVPETLGSFTFKAYKTPEEKQLKAEKEVQRKEEAKIMPGKKGKEAMASFFTESPAIKDEKEAKARLQYLQSGLSQRLQTENPFEDFRKAVEQAVIEKTVTTGKVFEGDFDFCKEQED